MNTEAGHCRNCASLQLVELGRIGELAPFFLARVFNLEIGLVAPSHPLKRLLRKYKILPNRLLSTFWKSAALVEREACRDSLFGQSRYPFPEELLGNLYKNYRSRSYNEERIKYEPHYAAIAERIGQSEQERHVRVKRLTTWRV